MPRCRDDRDGREEGGCPLVLHGVGVGHTAVGSVDGNPIAEDEGKARKEGRLD